MSLPPFFDWIDPLWPSTHVNLCDFWLVRPGLTLGASHLILTLGSVRHFLNFSSSQLNLNFDLSQLSLTFYLCLPDLTFGLCWLDLTFSLSQPIMTFSSIYPIFRPLVRDNQSQPSSCLNPRPVSPLSTFDPCRLFSWVDPSLILAQAVHLNLRSRLACHHPQLDPVRLNLWAKLMHLEPW